MKRKLTKLQLECLKLGSPKASLLAKERKEQRIKEYNKNPKRCLYCNAPISYERKSAKFCNSSCAAKYNNRNRVVSEAQKEKTSKTLKSKLLREVKCCRCGKITYTNSTNYHNVLCDNCRVKIGSSRRKHCIWCGVEKGKCKHPEICKLHQVITKSLIPNFEFDPSTIGTGRIYEEFTRIKDNTI